MTVSDKTASGTTVLDKTVLDKTVLDKTMLDKTMLDKTMLDKTTLGAATLSTATVDTATFAASPRPRPGEQVVAAQQPARAERRRCRFCQAPLRQPFVDLGMSPLANSYLREDQLSGPEPFYPLCVYVCERCFLVQLEEFESPHDIFSDYAYFSSYSTSWLQAARSYVEMAIPRFGLGPHSQVVEIASNDGYLLQYFVERRIPVLGIEPAANIAQAAIAKGIPTRTEFFDEPAARRLVAEGIRADLIVGNNVLAHVPQLNDFVAGLKQLLNPQGVITLEFPHLMRLMEENQFDTIYHEHFSYFSLLAVTEVLALQKLKVFDVEQLPTHGGSLRLFVCHADDRSRSVSPHVAALLQQETAAGLSQLDCYARFGEQVRDTKGRLLEFLISARRAGRTIVGYGAPAKGNTLLNYCGIGRDFIDYTVDSSPHKQGRYLPGTHIPIFAPQKVRETRPDYLLILPWNLKDEIIAQMAHVREWGGQFVVPIPAVRVYE